MSPAVYRGPVEAAGVIVPVTPDSAELVDVEVSEHPAMKMVIVRSTISPGTTRYFLSMEIMLAGEYKNRFFLRIPHGREPEFLFLAAGTEQGSATR